MKDINSAVSESTKIITLYFLIALTVSWACFIPVALESQKTIQFPFSPQILLLIGIFGPFFAAFLLKWIQSGRSGVWQFFKRGFDWRFGYKIYFFIILIPIFTSAISYLIVGGKTPNLDILTVAPMFIVYFFLGGSFGEEFGWRGFALDGLLKVQKPLIASLIVGIIWAIWHLPLFWIVGTSQFYTPFWLFTITATALSVQYTWVYLRTNGNIFACLLFHTFTNITVNIFPIEVTNGIDERAYYESGFTILVAIILIIFDRKLR
jgi:membrane protease YdiL (CAAX protease family)